MRAREDEPIPYRLTPAGSRACVMAELAEQVAAVPRTRLVYVARADGSAFDLTAEPAEGAVST